MESEIWRVITEKVGKLEAFKSEREMQVFLMNNPAIIGCWDPESKDSLPSLVQEEVVIKGHKPGRCDLIGIARKSDEGDFELRIFELKNEEISIQAIDQLMSYLKDLKDNQHVQEHIKDWVLKLGLNGINDSNVHEIIDNPVGVLVGPKFSAEAIKKAIEVGLKGIRLARFKGGKKSENEYYIMIENQIGEIIAKRKYWSWGELIKANLISSDDAFSISHQNAKLIGYPDKNFLNYNWIKIIFDDASAKALIEKEEDIKQNAQKDPNASKWIEKDLISIKKKEGVWLSHATALCYFAYGGPTASYWVPTNWWKHEKTGKWLITIVNEYHKKISKR